MIPVLVADDAVLTERPDGVVCDLLGSPPAPIALALCLLNEALVDGIELQPPRAAWVLQIRRSEEPGEMQLRRADGRRVELVLGRIELERWMYFFLKYTRDGLAEVDHFDADFDVSELTVKVSCSQTPVSEAEARRRLGLAPHSKPPLAVIANTNEDCISARSRDGASGMHAAVASGMTQTKWYAPPLDMSEPRGPFRPEHVSDGDRYEISHGHPVHVAPAGGRHGREHLVGALSLATDPAVREAGIDVGYALDEHTLRAPEISVGNVPDAPGWARGAPLLAVEYADRGTDEQDLQAKISELLRAGTRLVWVVRLLGPRRVDVHANDAPPRTVPGGDMLEAPGILSRPVPVDALFDRDRAREITLSNLLAEQGFGSLEAARAQARAEGHLAGLCAAVETLCRTLSIAVDRAQLATLDEAALSALLAHLAEHRTWPR